MFIDFETFFDLSIKAGAVKSGIGYRQFYKLAYKTLRELGERDPLAWHRACVELDWYKKKRPYFNLHPLIEKKLLEINEAIQLKDLGFLPLGTIEIRTKRRSYLVCEIKKEPDCPNEIFCSIQTRKDVQDFAFTKDGTVGELRSRALLVDHWDNESKIDSEAAMLIIAGVCMLAKDKSIVTPVILNADRRENMSDEKIEKYAKRAIRRTGRIGFDVGRELERNKALAHYRNGCFAVYHVGKDHELYPDNCEADRVPVIKWRNGAIVNRDNVPRVPTGFKG